MVLFLVPSEYTKVKGLVPPVMATFIVVEPPEQIDVVPDITAAIEPKLQLVA